MWLNLGRFLSVEMEDEKGGKADREVEASGGLVEEVGWIN